MASSSPSPSDRSEQTAAPVNLEPVEAPKPSSRRPFMILGGLVFAGLLVVGSYLLLTANKENTDDAQVEADVVPLAARVSGQVKRVRVLENQLVKQGDVVLEIDDADYAARVKQAQAELDNSKALLQATEATGKGGLSSARAGVFGSAEQVVAARASLARSEADARKATLDLDRTKALFADNVVPKERLDNAQAASDSANAALEAAKAQVNSAAQNRVAAEGRLTQSSPVDAQIASAAARVKGAEAALELAQNQLSYARVLAPADGMVSKLAVHEGQLIQVGQPIVDFVPAQTYVVANFKETQLGRMRSGQSVHISIDAFPGRELEGKVESLSGGTGSRFSLLPPDNASGNFVKVVQRVPVRISWINPPSDLSLRPGLSADVTVTLK